MIADPCFLRRTYISSEFVNTYPGDLKGPGYCFNWISQSMCVRMCRLALHMLLISMPTPSSVDLVSSTLLVFDLRRLGEANKKYTSYIGMIRLSILSKVLHNAILLAGITFFFEIFLYLFMCSKWYENRDCHWGGLKRLIERRMNVLTGQAQVGLNRPTPEGRRQCFSSASLAHTMNSQDDCRAFEARAFFDASIPHVTVVKSNLQCYEYSIYCAVAPCVLITIVRVVRVEMGEIWCTLGMHSCLSWATR